MDELVSKRRNLRQMIDQHFNLAELRALCFDLNIDAEHLSGDNKLTRIHELILYVERTNQLPLLLDLLVKDRPSIDWQNLVGETSSVILVKQAQSLSFANTIAKYLESLQATILDEYRQDQYVSLSIEALDSEDAKTIDVLKHTLQTSLNIETADISKGGEVYTVDEAINQNRLVGLLGDPGIGKTTSLRYLVLKYLDAFKTNRSTLLPIWVSLGKWDEQSVPAIEFIYSEFETHLPHVVGLDEFTTWLNNGDLILFLDGLNELPERVRSDVVREKYEQLENLENKIDARENSLLVLARNSQSRFVLSCRVREYIHYTRWREFLILPLNDAQINNFISNHLGHAGNSLERFLARQPLLRNLLRTPFFLRSIIFLAQENWQVTPDDRFQLVQFTCQAALNREISRFPESYKQVVKSFGGGSLNLMERGIIGSTFTVSREVLFAKRQEDNTDDILVGKAIQIVEDSGLLMRVSEDKETIRYRYLHQLVQEAIVLLHLQQEGEQNQDTDRLAVEALRRVGEIHSFWGLIKEAQENLERALELCPVLGSEALRAKILINQSKVARQKRQTRRGLPKAQSAVELAETTNDQELQAKAYHELGIAYQRLRNKKQAEQYFFKALEIREDIGDKSQTAYEMLNGLGSFYSARPVYKIKKALSYQMEALKLFELEKNILGIARAKEAIARSYRLWGETKKSEEYLRECIDSYEEINYQTAKFIALDFLGTLYRDRRCYDEAINPLQQAYEHFQEIGLPHWEISILIFGFGWLNMYQGRYKRALELIEKAHTLAQQQASSIWLLEVYGWGYGVLHWQFKNFKEASKYFELYESTLDEEGALENNLSMRMGILWMRFLGRKVSTSRLAVILSLLCWYLNQLWRRFNNPSTRLGKYFWRLFWWFNSV